MRGILSEQICYCMWQIMALTMSEKSGYGKVKSFYPSEMTN